MIKVITCRLGKNPSVDLVDDVYRHTHDDVIKGGYVEIEPLLNGVYLYCDEDGLSKGLKYNRALPAYGVAMSREYDFVLYVGKEEPAPPGALGLHKVVGDFVLVQRAGSGVISMSKKNEEDYLAWLSCDLSLLCRRCGKDVPTRSHIYCGAACSAQAEAHQ